MAAPARAELLALGAIVVVAALVRIWRLDHQSLWLNEAFTHEMMQRSFGGMVKQIADTETTPPLYYVLEWLWTRVAGTSAAGLRSLSTLFGILLVPVIWRCAREAFSARAGLIAAAVVAAGPYFVWFSQEARSYELLALMTAIALTLFLRALREPTARALGLWGIAAALALLTHYFAAFLVVPEAAWLIWRTRSRAAVLASAPLAIAGLALLPLALHQRGHTDYIAKLSFSHRLFDTPKKLVTGELGTPTPLLGPLAGLLVVAGVALALAQRERPKRDTAWLLAALAALAIALPVAMKVVGVDLLIPENELASFAPVAVLVGGGYAAARAGRWGVLAAALLCALMLAVDVQVQENPSLQRDDWRGTARALARPAAALPRAVVLSPSAQLKALQLYAGPLPFMPPQGAAVREVDLVGYARPPALATAAPPPPPGFRRLGVERSASQLVVRYVARAPVPVAPGPLTALKIGPKDAIVLFQTTPFNGGP